ncbi:MAG TPA: entericidin A/B family lipoprotein [Gammaproteobacteria bacterium]
MHRLAIASFAAMTLGIAACNTVEGVGEDVEAAGDAIEDEADERN